MPTRPATAPEISMVSRIILLTLTPLATAAGCGRPVARRSKPKRVRSSRYQYATPTTTATMMKPKTSWPARAPGHQGQARASAPRAGSAWS